MPNNFCSALVFELVIVFPMDARKIGQLKILRRQPGFQFGLGCSPAPLVVTPFRTGATLKVSIDFAISSTLL